MKSKLVSGKLVFTIILFLLTGLGLKSQPIAIATLEVKSPKAQTYSYNDGKRLTYFIKDGKTLHVLVYDSLLRLIKSTDFELSDFISKSDGVINVAEIDQKPTLFFGSKKRNSFSTVSLDPNSFHLEQYDLPELDEDENEVYLNSFPANNRLYVICLRNKKPFDLVIAEVQAKHALVEHVFSLADFELGTSMDNISELFLGYYGRNSLTDNARNARNSKLKRIRWEEPNNNVSASSDAKFYCMGDSLVITSDAVFGYSQMLIINLKTFNHTFKKIACESAVFKYDGNPISNSFLLDNNFYYVAASEDHLLLNIKNFESGKTIKEIVVGLKDSIFYKNGALTCEGAESDDLASWDTKRILKKLSRFNQEFKLGIGAFVDPYNKVELTIGNCSASIGYDPFLRQTVLMYMMNPPSFRGGMRMLLPSILWAEGFSNPPLYLNDNYYFNFFLDRDNLAVLHSSGQSFRARLDVIRKEIDNDQFVRAINTTTFSDRIVVACYNKRMNEFILNAKPLKEK